jgi:nucleotide-binding universal stress UspA family protein
VTTHVHMSAMKDVAHGIVLHEAELAPDLVIMCTHGRGGLRGLLFGRIAQQVAGSGNLPVLLIRPEFHPADQPYACRRVLVPTDGTARHSQGPATAVELARAVGAQLDLLAVVPSSKALTGCQATARRFAPGATQVMLELEEADLQHHLRNLREKCRGAGVATDVHLKRGESAAIIASTASEKNKKPHSMTLEAFSMIVMPS